MTDSWKNWEKVEARKSGWVDGCCSAINGLRIEQTTRIESPLAPLSQIPRNAGLLEPALSKPKGQREVRRNFMIDVVIIRAEPGFIRDYYRVVERRDR